jgi:hypothetical protein
MAQRIARLRTNGNPKSDVKSAPAPAVPSDAELRDLIAREAYYRAERRGFAPGGETEDWLEAEADVLKK